MPDQKVQASTPSSEVWLGPQRSPNATRHARSSSNASSTHSGNATVLGPSAISKIGQVSFVPSAGAPGAFSTDLKSSIINKSELDRPDFFPIRSFRPAFRDDSVERYNTERRQADYKEKIDKETKIKTGYENLLEALHAKNPRQTKDQRLRVESELHASERKISQLRSELDSEVQRAKSRAGSPSGRLSQLFKNTAARSPSRGDFSNEQQEVDSDTESPTFVLAEILQALEAQGMPSEYYVEHTNSLVDLFKRHPTLKYDLVWSIFGLRMQILLLNEKREVRAAAFRLLRHSITDRRSLQIIRSFHTDELVIISLVSESKASLPREQALKLVRAFLDVKDGVEEISRAVMRVIVAVAEHQEDRMQNICILTLAETMIRAPALVISAGGLGALCDALGDSHYGPAESLIAPFLYLLESPTRRKFLDSGYELMAPFAAFTDVPAAASDSRLKSNAAVISALLKSWPGLVALGSNEFMAMKSLTMALYTATTPVRDVILELLFDVLKIKPPSWSTSFLAGRRLTTYGRVNLKKSPSSADGSSSERSEQPMPETTIVDHFIASLLAVFLQSGLIASLLFTIQNEQDSSVRRKALLLLGEILNMAHEILPSSWSLKVQLLPELFKAATVLDAEKKGIASGMIYHIDSVNRTLYRTGQTPFSALNDYGTVVQASSLRRSSDRTKGALTAQIEEGQFRSVILDTQVLSTVNYVKWDWSLIEKIIEGPLTNPKRLEDAIRGSKFVKRLMGFYRPFKFRFSNIRNTKPNQRYVRIGCALFKTLLVTNEGVKYLAEHKLLAQVAECLAQVDRLSGLTSTSPIFAEDRLSDTLVGGYFAMLGVMSACKLGLRIMEYWKMANMFYHIIELDDRDDLIKSLLCNLDFTIDSHLRVLLSKALTSCTAEVRVFATRLLRKYATRKVESEEAIKEEDSSEYAEWAIRLLTTQLYDPDIEVCEAAVKILEETCNDSESLEFVVQCHPSLDHLGEIAAPLLLRFLSSSIGYHYLDGLDYISQEMDDWFLGRNDSYVLLVEASLAKVLAQRIDQSTRPEDLSDGAGLEVLPPHFYRELTRTAEGCKLLDSKGHFDEFVHVIEAHGMEREDTELMLKVKGCMWAVGNIGSMELGAPFLENTLVIERIVEISERSEVLSMRGTAFFALGLVSMSVIGQEILNSNGWDVAVDETGQSVGVCLPVNLHRLFMVPTPQEPLEEHELPSEQQQKEAAAPKKDLITDEDPLKVRILSLVTDLSNTPLTKSRANELRSIKKKQKAKAFHDPHFFGKVMALMEQHRYRFPILRFVIDLFDKNVMRRILFEDDDDVESSESLDDSSDEDSLNGTVDNDEDDDEKNDEARQQRQRFTKQELEDDEIEEGEDDYDYEIRAHKTGKIKEGDADGAAADDEDDEDDDDLDSLGNDNTIIEAGAGLPPAQGPLHRPE